MINITNALRSELVRTFSFIVCLLTTTVATSCSADATTHLPYSIKTGTFFTPIGAIPPSCFAQLMTELNGDNHIAAVYLTRNTLRGCIDANYPHPSIKERRFNYDIVKRLNEHIYQLKICQQWNEGSLRSSCDNVIIQFANRRYTTPTETLEVLSIEKVGEW